MRLIFKEEALDDLQDIFNWIAKDNPRAATRLIDRIFRKLELLLTPGFARMGRIGVDPGRTN
jgi:plasmid stabilization system protein ParE